MGQDTETGEVGSNMFLKPSSPWLEMFIPLLHPRINLHCGNVRSDSEIVQTPGPWIDEFCTFSERH